MSLLLVLGILQVVRGGQRVLLHRLHSLQLVLIKLGNSKLKVIRYEGFASAM